MYFISFFIDKDPSSEEKLNQPVDIVSAAIMAKILEEREKERSQSKHCETCSCARHRCSKSTQTYSDPVPSDKGNASLPHSNKIGKIGSVMAVRNRLNEKEKPNHVEISIEMNPVADKPKTIHFQGNWENESESSLFKIKKPPTNLSVAEGILVNIDSMENSSIKSGTSDSSSASWNSKSHTTKQDDQDLISFDKPASLPTKNESESRISGPRHCSVRMQLGSNNILLDNVVDPFTPVLYKSKTSDALVHSSRSRSGSSNSSSDEHTSTKKSAFRTETEI